MKPPFKPPRPSSPLIESRAPAHRDYATERSIETPRVRQPSQPELDHEADMAGVMRHNRIVEKRLDVLGHGVVTLARELGVADKLDPSLHDSLRPPPVSDAGSPKPLAHRPPLGDLARASSRSVGASLVAVALLILDFALRVVELVQRHAPHH